MSSKIIEQISTMTVKELSELVKSIEETFGVSAAAAVAAAPAGEAAAEAKTEFKVTLEDMGSEKIKVIKALRQVIPGLGLTDAKKLVEGTPSVLNESASKEDADKMKETIEAAGAKVKLS